MVYTIRPTRIPLRKKYASTTTTTTTPREVSTTTVVPSNTTVPTLRSRFRFATRKPYLRPSTTQATPEDQELGNAGEIAVAVHGLSTAPLPREPIKTTAIPKNHRISTTVPPQASNIYRISTTVPPQASKLYRISTTVAPQASTTAKNIGNNVIPQKSFNQFPLTQIINVPDEPVPQRTTQYFPTYGKFPQPNSSTRSELTFFQSITRPTSATQTTLATQQYSKLPTTSNQVITTPQRGIPSQIFTRIGTNIPQVVEQTPSRTIQQDYTGLSTVSPEITRQYQQYRISTQSTPISRNVDSQKTLQYPRISPIPPQIISRPIEIESSSPRQTYTNQQHIASRPTELERLPPPRGLTPEEFARLSPPTSHLISRTPGIETESTRSLTTPDRSQRITLIARPVSGQEYDYYDSSVLSQLPPNSKVLVLPSGAFQCLDRGNFPHPESCKKFISCYEGGVGEGIIGWEYTCPRGLSFDPIGGICNWSAGLGCKQLN